MYDITYECVGILGENHPNLLKRLVGSVKAYKSLKEQWAKKEITWEQFEEGLGKNNINTGGLFSGFSEEEIRIFVDLGLGDFSHDHSCFILHDLSEDALASALD